MSAQPEDLMAMRALFDEWPSVPMNQRPVVTDTACLHLARHNNLPYHEVRAWFPSPFATRDGRGMRAPQYGRREKT